MIRSIALALSLAIATPAAADHDRRDHGRITGGVLTLRIIDLSTQTRRERHTVPIQRTIRPHITRSRPSVRHDAYPSHRARILPDACLRTFRERHGGAVTAYGARCTQNRVARPGSLPPQCLRRVYTTHGLRNVYGPRCLSRAGWSPRTARR